MGSRYKRFVGLAFLSLALLLSVSVSGQQIFSDRFQAEERESVIDEVPIPEGPAPQFSASLGGARVLQALEEGVVSGGTEGGVLTYQLASQLPSTRMATASSSSESANNASNLLAVFDDGSSRLALESDLPINVAFSLLSPDGREVYLVLSERAASHDDPLNYGEIIAREDCAIFALEVSSNNIRCVAPGLLVRESENNQFNARNDKPILFDDARRGGQSWQGSLYFRGERFDTACELGRTNCRLNRNHQEFLFQVPWGEEARQITTDLQRLDHFQVLGRFLMMYGYNQGRQIQEVRLYDPAGEMFSVHEGGVQDLVSDDHESILISTGGNIRLARPSRSDFGGFDSVRMNVGSTGRLIVADDGVLYGFDSGQLRRVLPYGASPIAEVRRDETQDWGSWWASMQRTPVQIARGFVLYVENVELPRIGRVDVIRMLDLQTGEERTLLNDNLAQFRAIIFNWRLSGTTLYFSGQNLRNNDTILGELDLLAIRDGASVDSALTVRVSASASGAVAQVQDIEVLRPAVPTRDVGGAPRVSVVSDVINGQSVSLSFTKYMDKETLETRLTLRDADGNAIDYMPMWLLQTLHMVPDLDSFDRVSSSPLAQSSEYQLEFSPGIRDLWNWDLNLADSDGLEGSVYRFNTMGPKFVALANSSLNGRSRPDFGEAFPVRNILSFKDVEPSTSLKVPFLTPAEFSSLENFSWEFGYWSDGLENNGSVQLWGDDDEHLVVIFREEQIVLKYVDDQGVHQLATSRVFDSTEHQARYGWNRLRITRLNGNYTVYHAKGNQSWRRLSFLKGHRLVNEIEGTHLSVSSGSLSLRIGSGEWGLSQIDLAGMRLHELDPDGDVQRVLMSVDQVFTGTRVMALEHSPATRQIAARAASRLGAVWYEAGARSYQVGRQQWVPPSISSTIGVVERSWGNGFIAPMPGVRDVDYAERMDNVSLTFWAYPCCNSAGLLFGDQANDIFAIDFRHRHLEVTYLSPEGLRHARSIELDQALGNDWVLFEVTAKDGTLSVSASVRGETELEIEFEIDGVLVDEFPLRQPLGIERPHVYLTGSASVPQFAGMKLSHITGSGSVTVFDMEDLQLDGVNNAEFAAANGRSFAPTIDISISGNGAVEFVNPPAYGQQISVVATPGNDYSLVEISGCGGFSQSGDDGYRTNGNLRSSCEIEAVFQPSFQLHENGVTVLCPHAAIGASGTVNASGEGPRFTRRSRDQITAANAATSCTTGIESMDWMFNAQEGFNGDIRGWDTSTVKSMAGMFQGAISFNQNIGDWDTSSVENMNSMFRNASSFDADISKWNVSSVVNMQWMFYNTPFNQDIGSWRTSSLNNTFNMFARAELFNQDIGNWHMSAVENLAEMFRDAKAFNQDIGLWDTGSAARMDGLFIGAEAFDQDISGWNTSSVVTMRRMFHAATSFNQPLGWDTGSVTDMNSMFLDATAFNQSIGTWNTSNVLNMQDMFRNARSFNQNLSTWCVSRIESKPDRFDTNTPAWVGGDATRPQWGQECN